MRDSHDLPNARERFDLNGKTIVVTGGAGILGAHYCLRLAEAGAKVVVADVDKGKCTEVADGVRRRTGARVLALPVDLTSEQSVMEWKNRIVDNFDTIDVLVNNAAYKGPGFFEQLEQFTVDSWNQVMEVNVRGVFLAAREIGPIMVSQGRGSIVNISSIYGVVGPDQKIYEGAWYEDLGGAINTPLVYCASKGAVISMTRYLATYWGPKGVRTNTLTPGGVSSGQNSVFEQRYSERVPLGRMADTEDMVGALIFLASDASRYFNGQNIIVDGGFTAW